MSKTQDASLALICGLDCFLVQVRIPPDAKCAIGWGPFSCCAEEKQMFVRLVPAQEINAKIFIWL